MKKQLMIDTVDREILRFMHNSNRNVSGLSISKAVKLTPPAIKPRLIKLHSQGVIKPFSIGEERVFKRTFGNSAPQTIKSKSKVMWGIDFKK